MDQQVTSGSIVDILPSALAALSGQGDDPLGLGESFAGARRAVVIMVDGLGYHSLPQAATASGVLAEVLTGTLGSVVELACCFPSTTPTSLVSLGTGALPGAHGVVGFRVNVPGTDRVLNHTHWSDDPDPRLWQPVRTLFETAPVSTEVFGPGHFAGSGLTVAAYRGAPYTAALAEQFPAAMLASQARLMYLYHPLVDRAGHLFGVGSQEWLAEIATVDRLLEQLVTTVPDDTAIVVTSDHGMLDFSAEDKIDFDAVPELREGVRVLAGEPRVRYVHTHPGAAEDVADNWRGVLGGDSLVLTRAEAVDGGWFGPVSSGHEERIGDVVVVCRGQRLVVSTHREPRGSGLVGYHGSVSREERGIPLIVIPAR